MKTYKVTTTANGINWRTRHFNTLEETENYMDSEFKHYEAKGYILDNVRDNGDVVLSIKNGQFGKKFIKISAVEL